MLKKLSLCIVMFLGCLGICSYKTEALTYETFIRYDLETGESNKIIIPGEMFNEFSEESERGGTFPEGISQANLNLVDQEYIANVSTEPYKWIGQLKCTDPGSKTSMNGSATLIDDSFALTAAHIVYQKDKKRPWQNVQFTVGVKEVKNGQNIPYKNKAAAICVPEAYTNEAVGTSTVIHDYALVEFEDAFPKSYGHFDVYVSDRLDSFDPSIHTFFCTANMAGFVTEGTNLKGLYKGRGDIDIWKNYVLDSKISLMPGQGGGPIYRLINGKYCLLGINCQLVFANDGSFQYNRGRCITPTVKNFINRFS